MDLEVPSHPSVRPARRGLPGRVSDKSEEPVAQASRAKEKIDECFENRNYDCVWPRADGRGSLTDRKGGRMEPENRDDFQRAGGNSRSAPQRVGGFASRHLC